MPVELAPSAREYGCDPKARSNPLRIPSPSAAQEPESRWKPRGIPMGCNTKCPGQTLGLPLECPSSSERPISRHTSSSPLRNSMTRTLDAVPKCHFVTCSPNGGACLAGPPKGRSKVDTSQESELQNRSRQGSFHSATLSVYTRPDPYDLEELKSLVLHRLSQLVLVNTVKLKCYPFFTHRHNQPAVREANTLKNGHWGS